jgi:rubredoxin
MDDIEYIKELQEKFDKEEVAPYSSLMKQYSSDKEAEGYKLDENDWVWEKCEHINKMPNYKCKKCYKENEMIKEIAFQKMMLDREEERKKGYQSRPYNYRREESPVNHFRPADKYDYLKKKWECRKCNVLQSAISDYWEKCYKKRDNVDKNLPHWELCKKSLTKKTIPMWKECRVFKRSSLVVPKTTYKTRVPDSKLSKYKYSYQWADCKSFYRTADDWIPIENATCKVGHKQNIFYIRWNEWGKITSSFKMIKDHIWDEDR